MKTLNRSLLLSIGALALAGTAYGQVPSSNDTSTTDGNNNTGMGTGALGGPTPVNLTGTANTASGYEALFNNSAGIENTASGAFALQANQTGASNTAFGYQALHSNQTGSNNTASGVEALFANTGNENTATGFQALYSNSTGKNNTASGALALFSNTDGVYNTASGWEALYSNTVGSNNTAAGLQALLFNTSGNDNSAYGYTALNKNTTGTQNTASGFKALYSNTTGSNNIALGSQAGLHLTTGSNDIDIGNAGKTADNNTIRIGTAQTKTFIAGINGTSVTGSAVMVSSTGQLGVTVSSERFKTAIEPMGSNTAKLEQLRPVTFHLKTDPKGALQYGLIAEEVAQVYPELVIRNESGRIDGVRYDELAPMLLNEVQQQQTTIAAQAAQLQEVQQKLGHLQAALTELQAKEELVANR